MEMLRSSKVVFAVAYVVLIAGVFLALGGSAYAASSTSPPSEECDVNNSAADQYCEETSVPTVEASATPGGASAEDTRVAGVKVSATAGGDTASAEAVQAEALPNTGLSLLGVVVVGGALVAGGLVLRRREQRKN
jgi:LPXTG-motif cell wall-anchored protein